MESERHCHAAAHYCKVSLLGLKHVNSCEVMHIQGAGLGRTSADMLEPACPATMVAMRAG
jgi:hypothetical protein